MDGDLTGANGLATATKYIAWVGDNMPGYEHPRKAAKLVSVQPDIVMTGVVCNNQAALLSVCICLYHYGMSSAKVKPMMSHAVCNVSDALYP